MPTSESSGPGRHAGGPGRLAGGAGDTDRRDSGKPRGRLDEQKRPKRAGSGGQRARTLQPAGIWRRARRASQRGRASVPRAGLIISDYCFNLMGKAAAPKVPGRAILGAIPERS